MIDAPQEPNFRRRIGLKLKAYWAVLANRREGRVWAATSSDLALFLVLAILAGSATFAALAYLSVSEALGAVPTVTAAVAVVSVVGAIVAHCIREANRRVTTVDVFIGDVQTLISQIGLALRSDKLGDFTLDADEACAIRAAILSIDNFAYDKMIARMDDLLRIQVRFIAAFYAEVRTAKARLTSVVGVKPASDLEIYALAFRIMKRGIKAVEKLTDVDEKKKFEEYKAKTEQLRKKLEVIGTPVNGDFYLYRKLSLQFMDDTPPNNEKTA
jgi:hypothetical protein